MLAAVDTALTHHAKGNAMQPDELKWLGEMYVMDPRFTANLDKWYGAGFAQYLHDAIVAT